MESEVRLAAGAMVALGLGTAALVVMPYIEVRDLKPLPGLKLELTLFRGDFIVHKGGV